MRATWTKKRKKQWILAGESWSSFLAVEAKDLRERGCRVEKVCGCGGGGGGGCGCRGGVGWCLHTAICVSRRYEMAGGSIGVEWGRCVCAHTQIRLVELFLYY